MNSYLRVVNAYHRWLHTDGLAPELIRIPKLWEEYKILATLTPEHVARIVQFKPQGKHEHRIHVLVLLMLDCGLRADEGLSLRREDVDLDNLLVRLLVREPTGREASAQPAKYAKQRA